MNRRTFLSSSALASGVVFRGGMPIAQAAGAKLAGGGSPIVETTGGKVRGVQSGKVFSFKGVHYGNTTTGKGRFMPPSKVTPWADVKDALDIGQRAPQLPGNLVPEYAVMERSEPMGGDCLCVNVFTTGIKDNRKRPVMVWLHGGVYSVGSGGGTAIFDGSNLALKHDVVVVTLNHRLNVFGYLYLADIGGEQFANASNAGMLDIILALEWVRDNAATFGGDPGNVTIFGQSGGGGKVSTLLGMPGAKGLFHRAIAMSGSAVRSITREDATKASQALMKSLNITNVADLQTVPMLKLLSMTRPGAIGMPWFLGPVVDGKTLPEHVFDPKATPISENVPLLTGSTETELTWNAQQQYDPLDDAALRANLSQSLRISPERADTVAAIYKKNRPMASNLDVYLIAISDNSGFRTGTDTQALRKAELAKAAVYKYYFQKYSPVRDGMLRSMHTMDIPFAFDNVAVAKTEIGSGTDLQPLADKMSTAWVAFARTGNPNHKGIPNWPVYTPSQRATMILNVECKVVNDPFREEKDSIAAAQKA